MFRNRWLTVQFLFAVLLALVIPLVNVFAIYPRHHDQVIDDTVRNSVRLSSHLARMALRRTDIIDEDFAGNWMATEASGIVKDFDLMKFKLFDQAGRVAYSTNPEEIGGLNTHDYFINEVMRGGTYTKVVRKDGSTLEGENAIMDVVETYVPIMKGERFVGAFEVYQEITQSIIEHEKILFHSMSYLLVVLGLFLGGFIVMLRRLDTLMSDQEQTSATLAKKQKELLKEQENQQRLMAVIEAAKQEWETTMDGVDDMLILADGNQKIRRCNEAVRLFAERGYEELLGLKWVDIFENDPELAKKEEFEAYEYFYAPRKQWFYIKKYSINTDRSNQPGYVIAVHDITDIKNVSKALEEKNTEIAEHREKLQASLNQLSDLIQSVVKEKHFNIFFNNPELDACWKRMDCNQEQCPCFGKEPQRCWQRVGTMCGGETQGHFAQKYGNCINCRVYKNSTEDPVYMIGEQFNNMMHILAQKNAEVQKAYDELKQTQAQLLQQEKMASVGQLAAGIAHEINNPVGFILSNLGSLTKYTQKLKEFIRLQSELIEVCSQPEAMERMQAAKDRLKIDFVLDDVVDLISESLDGCNRVKKIVLDLKGFSRVDQAKVQAVDINECIESTINIVWNELKYKVTLEKHYAPLEPILCYPQQLNQVFLNLLINASQAIEENGVITISTWQDEAHVFIRIADNGCGIDPESLGHIFEPFYTTKEVGKGTGLGLSIVFDIIAKNHDGDIAVLSEPGQGTSFTITLPRNNNALNRGEDAAV